MSTKSKKLVLAQYWFDVIDSYRAKFLNKRRRRRRKTKISP